MPVPNWPAFARAALRFLADRVLRGLLALGAMTTGVSAPGWLKARGENWWEGAAPTEGTGPRAVLATARTEPGGLDDPGVLRRLRALQGSQDLAGLIGPPDAHTDAAPLWHPERRPAGGS